MTTLPKTDAEWAAYWASYDRRLATQCSDANWSKPDQLDRLVEQELTRAERERSLCPKGNPYEGRP